MNIPYKVCPGCGQPAVLDMQVCRRCGHQYSSRFVSAHQTQAFGAVTAPPPALPPPPPNQHWYGSVAPPGFIYKPAGTHSPWIAFLLSFVVVCFGQFYNRQFVKGLAFLACAVFLAVFTFGLSVLITWPMACIDAWMIAVKINRGQLVREWECF